MFGIHVLANIKNIQTRVTVLKTYMVLISTVDVMFSQLVQSDALCLVNEELKATVLLSIEGKAYLYYKIGSSFCFKCSFTS